MDTRKKKPVNLTQITKQGVKKVSVIGASNIAEYYKKKYGIKIIINGSTPYGLTEQHKKQQAILNYQQRLSTDVKYAQYVLAFWCRPGNLKAPEDLFISDVSTHPAAFTPKQYQEIYNILKPYLDADGSVISSVEHSSTDLRSINNQLKKLSFLKKIDNRITKAQSFLETAAELRGGIGKKEVEQEIRLIQQQLPDNEFVGYVFTNGVVTGNQHFEVLLISSDEIIKPVTWGKFDDGRSISRDDIHDMIDTGLKFMLEDSEVKTPVPQSTQAGCGTLGLLYLKELLKEDAKQLRDFCSFIPYYDYLGNLSHFFFPSPQVLRYSQSSLYNRLIVAALNDAEKVTVSHNGKTHEVKTLKALLDDALKAAHNQSDRIAVKQINRLIKKLPEFRAQWLKEYEAIQMNHAAFATKNGNQALAARTQKFKIKEINGLIDDLTKKVGVLTKNGIISLESIRTQLFYLNKADPVKAEAFFSVLSACLKKETLAGVIIAINNVCDNPALKKHRHFNFFPSTIRSDPTTIRLLKELKDSLEIAQSRIKPLVVKRPSLANDSVYDQLLLPIRGNRKQ